MLYIDESEVRQLLPMPEAIRLTREVFVRLSRGEALNHPRRRLHAGGSAVLHYMAGSDGRYFGAKVYSSHRTGAHFLFLLFRVEDAVPLAVMEANYLGQLRTGAATGVATEAMARPDAGVVGLIGTGFQARSQLEAVAAVRPLRAARVWSRSEEKRQAFVRQFTDQPVSAAATAEEAVRGADIVITATYARDPVLEDAWIAPGTHVNAVGSNQPKRRELPSELIARADWIAVDSREQARIESGDLLLSMGDAAWSDPRVVELADVVSGRIHVRSRTDEITIFNSMGLAVEDVICAGYVYERAVAERVGREIGAVYS